MDRSSKTFGALEAVSDSSESQLLHELNDLQLAHVGGGSADPIYH